MPAMLGMCLLPNDLAVAVTPRRQLGAANRTEAVALARELSLIP